MLQAAARFTASGPSGKWTPIFWAIVALCFCFCFLSQTPAAAQGESAPVRLDGRILFQVAPGEGQSAAERARQIERRLTTLLTNQSARQQTPSVQFEGGRHVISVAGVPVVRITTEDAQDNVTTPEALAAQWAAAVQKALSRAGERRLSFGGRFMAETQASIETAFGRLVSSTIHVVPRALAALFVAAIFWFFARLVRIGLRSFFRRFVEDETTESLIKQVIYYAIIGIGIIVAVDALGFEPQTVVTGLGLTGLALGFALKDIISNFVSGVLILSLRPFDLGDQIIVGATEGSVERIELRATQIRTYDGRVALVPNADVFTSRIINNTANPVRRGSVSVYLGYGEDLEKVIRSILAAVPQVDGVAKDRKVAVRVSELGSDDVVLEATFWSDSRRSDFSETASHVRRQIVASFKRDGVGLPDPDRRVVEHRSRSED